MQGYPDTFRGQPEAGYDDAANQESPPPPPESDSEPNEMGCLPKLAIGLLVLVILALIMIIF